MKIIIGNQNDVYSGPWGFVARVVVMTLATLLATYILPGVEVDSIGAALFTAVVIALLNNFVRPILIVVTLPFTILSMGLFLLVINALIVLLASGLVNSFHVNGFGNAVLFSVLLTLFNYLLELPNKAIRKHDNPSSNEKYRFASKDDDNDFTPYEEVE